MSNEKNKVTVRVSQHSRNAANSIAMNSVSELKELQDEYAGLIEELKDLKEQKYSELLLMDKAKLSSIRRGTTPAEIFEMETEAMIPIKERLNEIASRKRYAEMRIIEIKQYVAANATPGASLRSDGGLTSKPNRQLQEEIADCLARLCKHFNC